MNDKRVAGGFRLGIALLSREPGDGIAAAGTHGDTGKERSAPS